MLIDKASAGGDVTIVLFPRSYNKRGDERLHSVQGVTLDGREVNIKLRVDEAMQGKENTPSIAEFSREDVKAKNPCLASPDNGPDAREGVLLFTGCEEDGENKKGILSFTARWGYVLASHSDAPEPVFGLGRVVMIADSHAAKTIHAEITELERSKVEGWEAISEHKRKTLSDPMLFSYYGQLYIQEEEKGFDPKNKESLVEFARDAFAKYTRNGVVGGLLIRIQDSEGTLVGGFSPEVFPRWKPGNSYQSADDVLGFFFRANAKHMTPDLCSKILVMPIKRYSCGPSFKNYYFLKKPEESLLKLRKRFLINNEPTVSEIAFALSRREDSGESFMLKYYPMGNPISSVADIGKPPAVEASPNVTGELVFAIDPSLRTSVGLSDMSAVLLPSWYSPGSMSGLLALSDPSEAPPTEVAQVIQDEVKPALLEVVLDPSYEAIESPQSSESVPITINDNNDEIQTAVSVEADNSDGDLSDLFADISDEELTEIEKAQQIALEERAKADRILAEEEAAQEALERAELEKNELVRHSNPAPDYEQDGASGAVPEGQESSLQAPPLRFVDDSAQREFSNTTANPKPESNQQVEYVSASENKEVAQAVAEPELSSLEKMLKMRGLL